MADIFMSYAREDEERIKNLVSAFEKKGWSVFWDRRIPAGKMWQSYIGRALSEAKCILVVWSHDSIISDWVVEEANDAKSRGLLIPVLLDPVEPPLGFRSIQAADLTDWKPGSSSAHFNQLAQDIAGLIGAKPRQPKPKSQLAEGIPSVSLPKATVYEPSRNEQAPSMPGPLNVGAQEPKTVESGFPVPAKKRRNILKRVLIVSVLAISVIAVLWLSLQPRRPNRNVITPPPESIPRGPSKIKPYAPVPGVPSTWEVRRDVVLDTTTRLMWMRKDFKAFYGRYAQDWRYLIKWVSEMNAQRYAGFSDWQVASIPEYRTIIGISSWREVFSASDGDYYWARNEKGNYIADLINVNDGSVKLDITSPFTKVGVSAPLKVSARLVRSQR